MAVCLSIIRAALSALGLPQNFGRLEERFAHEPLECVLVPLLGEGVDVEDDGHVRAAGCGDGLVQLTLLQRDRQRVVLRCLLYTSPSPRDRG